MTGRFRCFVAVLLPPQLREALGGFLAREAARVAGVKWVEPDRLHITLKFLGDVEAEQMPQLGRALDAALADVRPWKVVFHGAGAFPSPARPRVVWIGVAAGAAELSALAGRVEAALQPLGCPAEGRPFAPHLTVGRVKAPPRDPAALPRLLASVRDRAWGECLVSAAHLMRSELFPSGPSYSILHETCLSGIPRVAEGADR